MNHGHIITYGIFSLVVSFCVLTAALVIPNFNTIYWTFGQSFFSLTDKISFLSTLYGGLLTNFSFIGAVAIVIVALLFGLNTALLLFYIRKMRQVRGIRRTSAASLSGLMSGLFGIGCASCGSVIIVSLFGQFGAGTFIAMLPYGGNEFSIVAVLVLMFTTYLLVQKIQKPVVCDIQ